MDSSVDVHDTNVFFVFFFVVEGEVVFVFAKVLDFVVGEDVDSLGRWERGGGGKERKRRFKRMQKKTKEKEKEKKRKGKERKGKEEKKKNTLLRKHSVAYLAKKEGNISSNTYSPSITCTNLNPCWLLLAERTEDNWQPLIPPPRTVRDLSLDLLRNCCKSFLVVEGGKGF